MKLVVSTSSAPPELPEHGPYFALENGFFKDEGIDVEIKPLSGDPTAIRAIASGDSDASSIGFSSVPQAIQASHLKIISGVTSKPDFVLVGTKDIASAKDLAGKTLGVSAPGAISHQIPLLMVERAGGDPKQVDIVAIGGSAARVQALAAKKIDACALTTSYALRTAQYDFLHSIGDASKDLPNYVFACEIASENAIQQKREAIQAYVTANIRGVRWALQNPDKAAAVSQKVLPDVPKDEIANAMKAFADKQYWNVDGVISQQAWDFTIGTLVQSGDLKAPLKYEDGVLAEFTKAAVAKLGPYKA